MEEDDSCLFLTITRIIFSFLDWFGFIDTSLVLLQTVFHRHIQKLSYLQVFWEADLRSDVVAVEPTGGALLRWETSCVRAGSRRELDDETKRSEMSQRSSDTNNFWFHAGESRPAA